MHLVVTTARAGDIYSVDVDAGATVAQLQEAVERATRVPIAAQALSHNGTLLADKAATLASIGIQADDVILLDRASGSVAGGGGSAPAPVHGAGGGAGDDALETLRQSLLNDPAALARLASQNPALAAAAQRDPQQFRQAVGDLERQRAALQQRHARDMMALEAADPFDVEAQRRIEQAIQQQQIDQNMELAMEHNPEVFGRVTMLYVPIEIERRPVKAFVDSGAQSTIMSPELAEQCGIARLIDRRFAGIARGVGTAKILGRIHNAQLKIGSQHLACSFIVMENRGVDFLFGLDMLRRHQACIDLAANCLRIYGEQISFLAEHELPEHARTDEPLSASEVAQLGPGVDSGASSGASGPSSGAAPVPAAAVPLTSAERGARAMEASLASDKVSSLMQLGATRSEAEAALEAAKGDVDAAAGFLFQ